MFIKLTEMPNGEDLFIKPNEICAIRYHSSSRGSMIYFNKIIFTVGETQEEIIKMIEDSWKPKIESLEK